MDDAQLEQLLATLVHEDPPAPTADLARRVFDLRVVTDELAELAAEDDHHRPDDPDGSDDPDRTLVFASPGLLVAVALDGRRRRAAGQLDPPRPGPAEVRRPGGEPLAVIVDGDGRFTLDPVPPGPLQLVIEAPPAPGTPAVDTASVRTAWVDWLDQPAAWSEPAAETAGTGSGQPGAVGDLTARLLVRRAADALAAFRLDTTAGQLGDDLDDLENPDDLDQEDGTLAPVVSLAGRFDPPVATVTRTLAAAAQQGARRLPAHRWVSTDNRLTVTLAETPDGQLTLTAAGDPDLPADTVVAVSWAAVAADGDTTVADHLVTPLPLESAERRQAAYDVGSALELRSFHLISVELLPASDLTPALVEASLTHRAYGNAIRAWTELLDRHPDPTLRLAFDRALGQL